MKLRAGTPDDVPAMIELGRAMHGELSFSPLDFDPDVLGTTLHNLLDTSQFVAVVENDDGALVGVMLGTIFRSFFGRDWIANDIAVFLLPEHRRGSTAARLIRVFVQWAKLAGAKQIRPGVSTGHEGAERLYEALGFKRVGGIFCMDVGGGNE